MEDRGDQEQTRIHKEIVNQLAVIIKTSQIHDPSNIAVVQSITKFVNTVNGFIQSQGALFIELVGEYFYVNDSRVKLTMEYLINFDFLSREFRKLRMGSISFNKAIIVEDMQFFLHNLISVSTSPYPFTEFEKKMRDVKSITVGALRKIKEETGEVDVRKTVKRTYFNAVSFAGGVLKKIKAGEKINVKRAKRVVQSLVDLIFEQEELLLGMTAIKDYDDYTYHHSVNVSILSVSLGQKLGFDKQALLELGLVALFHDAGKTDIPPEILNKPSSFTEEEWRTVRKHPYWGVRSILKMKGVDGISLRAAIVSFEHHLNIDQSGYPKTKASYDLDLYSRIFSIADQYDGMTSARVYSRTPMPPDKALSLMSERAGKHLDPLLLKFFMNMVGVYPIGTAILLDTNEVGLVYSNNMSFPDRPKALVISDPKGNKVKGYIVDLTDKLRTGHYMRSIVRTMDPNKYKINLAEYLL